MRLDESNPVFRGPIVPWYDSNVVCLTTIGVLLAVVGFGLIGIHVARKTPVYADYIWVPTLLVLLSAGVVLSITLRLVSRHRSGRARWSE